MANQYEQEWIKCAQSFEYFCSKYVKILHPAKGLVSFKLYDFQKRVVREFSENQYNIVSKFRQAGLTTVAVIWGLWRCMFDEHQRVMILSKSDREAIAVGKIIRGVMDHLPDWLKPQMRNDNDHEKEFVETNSVMWFYTPEASRGKAVTFLIVDEAAFVPRMEEHWKAIYPVIQTGGACAIISTVNGIGNWYEETFTRAKDSQNQFHVIELDYKEHPDYNNPEWERKTRANLGEKGWLQEILRQFLGSGDTFIPGSVLQKLETMTSPPSHKYFAEWDTTPSEIFERYELANAEYKPGAMCVWKEPRAGREYLIAVDCAVGIGSEGDASVFHVFDMHDYEQVAEFQSNKIQVFNFAQVLSQVGCMYNEALIACENDTGPGMAVLDRLQNTIRYPNLHYSTTLSKRSRPGFSMGKTNRQVCLETMRACLSNYLVKINSARTVRELHTFIYDNETNRAKASSGKHDDLVMALAIALHVADTIQRDMPVGVQDSTDILSKAMLGESMEEVKKELEEYIPDDDMFDGFEDFEDIMPEITLASSYLRRPNEDLLREFNF